MHKLFLGSKSRARAMLLQQARIPFTIVSQEADETLCDWALPLPQLVARIAELKMNYVQLSSAVQGEYCFVLTADTLSQDVDGSINGKPIDRLDAVAKIKKARSGSTLCTAFCLDKKVFSQGRWHTKERIEEVVTSRYAFIVPDDSIDEYLDNSSGFTSSNAIAVEDFGMQFLQEVQGSYSAIVGLPLFELRQALYKIGFFSK